MGCIEGHLMRGLKWHMHRDVDGNYPKGITESEKMNDLNTYLDFVKGKDKDKINVILQKLSFMARTGKRRIPQYKSLLEKLNSVGVPEPKPEPDEPEGEE